MIHLIYSNLDSFKELAFRPGLNLLLTEKSQGATDFQTRNGAGKTSLIELIHFLTGSDADPDSIFRNNALNEHWFGIRFDLGGSAVTVERSGKKSSRILIKDGLFELSSGPTFDFGSKAITNSEWKAVLGTLMFKLPGDEGRQTEKNGPTFRSLFSYFVRRQASTGFLTATKQAALQQIGDQQVAVSYLLGLDWTIPQQLQGIRERERTLKELRKAVGEGGALSTIIGTTAELRTKLAIAEERTRRLEQNLTAFQVLPEYREYEVEASDLTRQLRSLSDDNTIDNILLADLEQSLASEVVPSSDDLERVYREAGIVLPNITLRRLEEVRAFHESVVHNRRSYLSGEIETTKQRMINRENQMHKLGSRRAELMAILQSHGALDQFSKLSSELARLRSETEALRQQFETAAQLEGQRTELELERGQLYLRLLQDYHEQETVLRQAIVTFEELSRELYEEGGSLTVDASQNGPQFQIAIHAKDSKGINNMQIFCFDMMLMQVCTERGLGPGFLVHDSHLFDGVDERQIAKALQIGARKAVEAGFQYIVTMNSDDVPLDLLGDTFLQEHTLPISLSDATESGGLFGIRFK